MILTMCATKTTDGGRLFPARDPDGNYIQVYHLYPQVQDMQQHMG